MVTGSQGAIDAGAANGSRHRAQRESRAGEVASVIRDGDEQAALGHLADVADLVGGGESGRHGATCPASTRRISAMSAGSST